MPPPSPSPPRREVDSLASANGLPPAAPPRRKHNTEAENYRKPWSEEEDGRLRALVQEHGMQQWAQIAQSMPGRNGKQCRERWHNQLDNCLTRDTWTEEEDLILLETNIRIGEGEGWGQG